jgi:5-methylcytosine-specific restriction protein A
VSGAYCDACRAKGAAKEQRPSSAGRGYGYAWQQASKAYLRAHPLAVDYFHEHKGRVMLAEVVDHIIPHRGNMNLFWDRSNWQGLTKADHDRKTATEDGGFGHFG